MDWNWKRKLILFYFIFYFSLMNTNHLGDGSGEFTAIFYNSERFNLLGEDTLWFCDTPTVPG